MSLHEDLARRFARTDLGSLMRDPAAHQVEMLIDGWLQKAALHWVQGPPEEGKSWVILWLATRVLRDGGKVCVMDEELGRRRLAERLVWLGLPAEVVDDRCFHHEFPSLTESDRELWAAYVDRERFGLVIFETGTDFLAVAGAPENSGDAVTAWIKDYPERAVQAGATAIVSDHVAKDGKSNGWAVASRAKRSKSKIVFEFRVKQPFGREKLGRVEVTVWKNTDDAAGVGLRESKRHLRMGGKDGRFVLDDLTEREVKREKTAQVAADKEFQSAVLEVLRHHAKVYVGSDAVMTAVRERGLKGEAQRWRNKLKEYAESPFIPIQHEQRGYFHQARVQETAS